MMTLPIYMDHHATTPVDPRVVEAMKPYFSEIFGNPASRSHALGWQAAGAVERARKQIADLIGASPDELVFTSGATESNNLAIKGAARASGRKGNHIITAATEHRAVLDVCRRLEQEGYRVTYLPVQSDGLVDADQVRRAVTADTVLITIMFANNEIGVLQPIAEIAAAARDFGLFIHTDATQAAGKVPCDVKALDVDLASFSAHKLYGPKGVGVLYVRGGDLAGRLTPLFEGGGQERGLRSGTLNVPGIVGFGQAAELARLEMAAESVRVRVLRDRLREGIVASLDGVRVNGSMDHRLPHNLNVSIDRVDAESLFMGINDIAVSPGSACTSATAEPSHVLRALGVSDELARSSIRFGLGRGNTLEQIEYAIGRLSEVVRRLRELSSIA
jgi:cysteine desulfurase